MFDYHMHSRISFDSEEDPVKMLRKAEQMGLREICFTDHMDYDPITCNPAVHFETEAYNAAYDNLQSDKVKIRRGFEFGMLADNAQQLAQDIRRREFDFVIGSVHYVEDVDIYFPPFWQGKTMEQAEQRFFEQTLACVRAHDDFDVLGHLTYISKTDSNPTHRLVNYGMYREMIDEILRELVRKGKGMEINTSGVDRCGDYLPGEIYLRRFKELGGEIVTVGSDAHNAERVGQYCADACGMLKEIFGYVCTIEDRKPIFHKL